MLFWFAAIIARSEYQNKKYGHSGLFEVISAFVKSNKQST